MSIPTSAVTIQSAVLAQVQEFVNTSTPFSIHDITVAIRSKTADGQLEIPEAEVSGASFRFDIPHTKVKAIFEELWSNGAFNVSFSLARKFNGMYFEYTPLTVQPVQQPPQVVPANPPSIVTSTPSRISQNDSERIKLYLTNCAKKNFRPTLKKIQSAIKRDGVPCCSCDELKAYVTTLGYTIVDDPEALSKSQVVV